MDKNIENINNNMGGGNFKSSSKFKSRTVQNYLYADDSRSSLCYK